MKFQRIWSEAYRKYVNVAPRSKAKCAKCKDRFDQHMYNSFCEKIVCQAGGLTEEPCECDGFKAA